MGNFFSFFSSSNEDRLFRACQANDIYGAQELIARLFPGGTNGIGPKLDAIRDSSGKTPLMVAAGSGAMDVLRLLRSHGASVDIRSTGDSGTALHYAAENGKRDTCLMLLDEGADVTAANALGFTAIDLARLRCYAYIVRALEKRTAAFYGWLKWERSSLFQAGVGKMLGASVKEAMQKTFGGEWRECWVVLTKLTGKSSNVMMCPRCRNQFSDNRTTGTRISCPNCSAELHIPQMPVVSILELAIYNTPNDPRPQVTFPLTTVSIESEFRVPDMRMNAVKMYLQRPAEAPVARKPGEALPGAVHGLVAGGGKAVLWGQTMLSVKASEVRSTKKVVFAVDDNPASRKHLARFISAIRSPPMNAVTFVAESRLGHNPIANTAEMNRFNMDSIDASLTTAEMWSCPLCTLENTSNARKCAACDTPRDASPLDIARQRQVQTTSGEAFHELPVKQTPSAASMSATIVPPPPIVSSVDEMLPLADDDDGFAFEEVPAHFICPITGEVMDDPVVTVDGMSFERRAIEQHFRMNGPVSPVTLMPLESASLAPNLALRRAIDEWKSSIPVASFAVITT